MADDQQTSETDETESDDQQDSGDDLEKMRAALKKANREAESFRRKLKDFEDAGKSEQEKLREGLTLAEQRADKSEGRYLRLKVGTSVGLPVDLAERLQGDNEDALVEDAKRLREALGGERKRPADSFDTRRNGGTSDTGSSDFLTEAIRNRRG